MAVTQTSTLFGLRLVMLNSLSGTGYSLLSCLGQGVGGRWLGFVSMRRAGVHSSRLYFVHRVPKTRALFFPFSMRRTGTCVPGCVLRTWR